MEGDCFHRLYIQAKSRTRVIWLGGIIRLIRIVDGIFRVTRTKARELNLYLNANDGNPLWQIHVISS